LSQNIKYETYFKRHYFSNGKSKDLNLINSCGYKSASLLGTKSLDGKTNVAILVALPFRSNPAMIGFIMRPTTVPRDTYKTLKKLDILQ
jgi:hypothetical protein